MALIPAQMQASWAPLNAPSTSGSLTAEIIMTGFQGYAMAAQNSMGFPVTAMPGFSAGKAQLKAAMAAPIPSGALLAASITGAISTAWGSVMTQFQTSPVIHVPPSLQGQLAGALAAPIPAGALFINALMNAIHTYVSTSNIIGVIPGTPPVPFAGPPL